MVSTCCEFILLLLVFFRLWTSDSLLTSCTTCFMVSGPKNQGTQKLPKKRSNNWKSSMFASSCSLSWVKYLIFLFYFIFITTGKEIVEKRHGEPIKFLFLPKMGLLGSQASTEKKIGCELWATFEGCFFMLSCAKIYFKFFFYIVSSALKSCLK